MNTAQDDGESSTELEALRRENEAQRARIAQLEAKVADARLLEAVVEHSPSIIFVKDPVGNYILVNHRAQVFYGRAASELLGRHDKDFFPPAAVEAMRAKDQEAADRGGPIQFEETVAFEDATSHYLTIKFPILDADGSLLGVCGIATDVTEQKRAEEERALLREQVIEAQEEALRELSTPLVPIADGIVAMPIVGSLDAKRADSIMATLLEGIGRHGAHAVILDITGVRTVDAHVAEAIVAAARAVGLLGARVVVTGIRPEVARTLIEIGSDLQGIVTRGTLQAGIRVAMSTSSR